jgi:PAS domain S-box-containing protein
MEEEVMVIDKNYKITDVNSAILKITGTKKKDVIGKHCHEVSHNRKSPCKPPQDTCPQKEVMKTGKQSRVIHTHFDKKGNEIYVELTAFPIKDNEGKITNIIEISRDITKRRQTERTQEILYKLLELSLEDISLEELLERVIDEIVNVPWIVLEKKGCIFLVDDDPKTLALKAQRGLHEALLIKCENVPFGHCICGRAAATKKIAFTGCLDEDHENTYDGIKPHGHYCIPILSSKRVLGVINLYVKEGHIRDKIEEDFLRSVANTLAGIIERRQAEEKLKGTTTKLKTTFNALKASEEQFRELFENSHDGMYLLDTEGKFTRVNRTMEELTGYKTKELLGKELLEIVQHEDKSGVKKRFASIVRGKEPLPLEFQIATKKEQIIDVEVRSAPIKKGDEIIGVQESATDISFRKALENELAALNEELSRYSHQLEQSNQLKGLFTDILRHDLLNPTGVIRNIAEIMEYDENMKGSQEIEVIKRNVTKLEDIIQNASQYAKLESEEALEKTELNLTELIENIISDLHPYAREKKMKVKFKPKKEHKINASGAIESVFVNILSNAIKYSPEETDIKIEVEDAGKNKRISVTDQGDGILDENKEAVFDRFTRRDKKGVKGTGLGLAITKRIVDLHKGKIWVEDNPEGKGTVFIVEIPQ